jgi:hypothetical protein
MGSFGDARIVQERREREMKILEENIERETLFVSKKRRY